MKALHISQIEHKTIEVLANADMIQDWYHDNIKKTARILLDNPVAGNSWEYVTQYSNGSCLYKLFEHTIIVNPKTGKLS